MSVCCAALGTFVASIAVVVLYVFRSADCDLTTLFCAKFRKQLRRFKGKVIWITGASSGIGEYCAYELSRYGAKLVISGTNEENLRKVKARCLEINTAPDAVVYVCPFNIAHTETHNEIVANVIREVGQIDILINNAGRSQRSLFGEIPLDIDREMFDINVFGTVSLTRCVMKHWDAMGKSGEVMVTSSVAGKASTPNSATYSATKFALHGYFEGLRAEQRLMRHPVHVTMACPGPVRSNIRLNAYTKEVGKKYGLRDTEASNLMETSRCAFLMCVALANRLDETWIAPQPLLALFYVYQYAPSFFRNRIIPLLYTAERLQKHREGQ